MDDETGVGVGDGIEHVEEQAQPPLDGDRGGLAVLIDRLPVDVLEHEVGLAGLRDPRIDEMGDVRMAKPGEDGAFALEPRLTAALDERDVQQLHRGAALEPAVASFGEPHVAAAALADGGEQPVRAKDLARERRHERQPRDRRRRPRGSPSRGPPCGRREWIGDR